MAVGHEVGQFVQSGCYLRVEVRLRQVGLQAVVVGVVVALGPRPGLLDTFQGLLDSPLRRVVVEEVLIPGHPNPEVPVVGHP